MNYVNLTSNEYKLKGFKEVEMDEETRIDAVIANLDEICKEEPLDLHSTRRGRFYQVIEFCSIGRVQFILLEASEDFLYSKSDVFQKVLSWVQRTTHYQFEVRGVCNQSFKEEQQVGKFSYFIIFYPKQTNIVFSDFNYIYCEKNYNINNSTNKYNHIIDYIFEKIKENLL